MLKIYTTYLLWLHNVYAYMSWCRPNNTIPENYFIFLYIRQIHAFINALYIGNPVKRKLFIRLKPVFYHFESCHHLLLHVACDEWQRWVSKRYKYESVDTHEGQTILKMFDEHRSQLEKKRVELSYTIKLCFIKKQS